MGIVIAIFEGVLMFQGGPTEMSNLSSVELCVTAMEMVSSKF